ERHFPILQGRPARNRHRFGPVSGGALSRGFELQIRKRAFRRIPAAQPGDRQERINTLPPCCVKGQKRLPPVSGSPSAVLLIRCSGHNTAVPDYSSVDCATASMSTSATSASS